LARLCTSRTGYELALPMSTRPLRCQLDLEVSSSNTYPTDDLPETFTLPSLPDVFSEWFRVVEDGDLIYDGSILDGLWVRPLGWASPRVVEALAGTIAARSVITVSAVAARSASSSPSSQFR
jgi:hypothetical protein